MDEPSVDTNGCYSAFPGPTNRTQRLIRVYTVWLRSSRTSLPKDINNDKKLNKQKTL